jgi:hypothetical protein
MATDQETTARHDAAALFTLLDRTLDRVGKVAAYIAIVGPLNEQQAAYLRAAWSCLDELRAALQKQIDVLGAPTADAGVPPSVDARGVH